MNPIISGSFGTKSPEMLSKSCTTDTSTETNSYELKGSPLDRRIRDQVWIKYNGIEKSVYASRSYQIVNPYTLMDCSKTEHIPVVVGPVEFLMIKGNYYEWEINTEKRIVEMNIFYHKSYETYED